ncbi:MAG TPA: hypothetical protein VK424_02825 [Thermoplasmata archaeon]|nr:hypothetical protein [Thermoplasmata archaeon]
MSLSPEREAGLKDLPRRATAEERELDFKSTFLKTDYQWVEFVKDIANMANCQGGVIVFWCDSWGRYQNTEKRPVEGLDQKEIIGKMVRYTGVGYDGVTLSSVKRRGRRHRILLIETARGTLVYVADGNYGKEPHPKEKDLGFHRGQVPFRRGSTNDIATAIDLERIIEDRAAERTGEALALARGFENCLVEPVGPIVELPRGKGRTRVGRRTPAPLLSPPTTGPSNRAPQATSRRARLRRQK